MSRRTTGRLVWGTMNHPPSRIDQDSRGNSPEPVQLKLTQLHSDTSAPVTRSKSRSTVPGRSEEHTSELQSLMRISYAVFCLKKKKQYYIEQHSYISTLTNTAL